MSISWKYPTITEAEEAGLDLYKQFTSTHVTAEIAKDCACVIDYALSLGLPVSATAFTAPANPEAELTAALKPLATKTAGASANIDWLKLARLALLVLKALLGV